MGAPCASQGLLRDPRRRHLILGEDSRPKPSGLSGPWPERLVARAAAGWAGWTTSAEEGEPSAPWFQWARRSDQSMDPNGPVVALGRGEVDLLETNLVEPPSYGRCEVRMATMSGPDHLGSGSAELGCRLDGRAHVGVADVAEDAAQQHEVSGRRVEVTVAACCVPFSDHHGGSRPAGGLTCPRHQAGVVLDEQCADPCAVRALRQNPEQVSTVAGTRADDSHRARRRVIQATRDGGPDGREPVAEAGAGT